MTRVAKSVKYSGQRPHREHGNKKGREINIKGKRHFSILKKEKITKDKLKSLYEE